MPAFLTGPLLKFGVLALIIGSLALTIYVQHVKLTGRDAQLIADRTELNSERMVNTTLSNQVIAITQDAKEAAQKAADAEKALAEFQAKGVQAVSDVQKQIIKVAVPSDDACSPALAVPFNLMCPKSGSPNDNAAATNRATGN